MCHNLRILPIAALMIFIMSGCGRTESPMTAVDASSYSIAVSGDGRCLVRSDGAPFFYLADTAWELFHRLSYEETEEYLKDRASKGFTVIQAVAVAELDGLTVPSASGFLPFKDSDPSQPLVLEGPDNDYWDHIDKVVGLANSLGLQIAMLPTWGRWWHDGDRVAFNPENAFTYGRFLGERYRDAGLIWVLGGDRNPENAEQYAILEALVSGLDSGDGGCHLMTYHPGGGHSSSEFFHEAAWLDFNMRQNGHDNLYAVYDGTLKDYLRTPVKPVLDGEPIYEDHPIAFNPDRRGHSTAADVRRALYWDLMNGAMGHTYGHHSIWQMYDGQGGQRPGVNGPLMSWRDAMAQEGSSQMVYGKNLILSRPMVTRVPCTSEAFPPQGPETSIPGSGNYRFAAARDTGGSCLMVYVPLGRSIKLNTSLVSASRISLWWFDPRTGSSTQFGTMDNPGTLEVTPPSPGEAQDWILVVDDASKGYPAPGVPLEENI